jgi:hypothetical protein
MEKTFLTVQPRIYRMAPELRRSAIYAMVGFALLAVVGYVIHGVVLERDLIGVVVGNGIFIAVSLARIVPLRWALRVDGSGIARRWLFRWDQWSWDDFASGRIEKRYPLSFVE